MGGETPDFHELLRMVHKPMRGVLSLPSCLAGAGPWEFPAARGGSSTTLLQGLIVLTGKKYT